MTRVPGQAAAIVAGVALSAAGYALAERVVPRLSDHRGFFLVAHRDAVAVPPAGRPRRAVVVVVDGLRRDHALTLGAVARVRAAGRCAVTDVGLPSVSRPVYTVISSGVEQSRTGVRNNDETAPAPVDALWNRARAAGLRVAVRSELPWWAQLFPQGFDDVTVGAARDDLFAAPLGADLTLIHPVYVDDLSHDHGARSPEVRRALARVDGEMTALLDRVDLGRDLVVVTADHGHRDAGGHGGAQPEVTRVLTCFGGWGVRRDPALSDADTRDIAPTLAVLLGLPLPRHAATRVDPTPLIRAVVDPAVVGRGYLDARLAGIADIPAVTREALRGCSGDPGATWSSVDAAARSRQHRRGALALALGAALLVVGLRRLAPQGDRLRCLVWSAGVAAAHLAIYRALSGGLEATSLNGRTFFTRNVLVAAALAYALGALAHRRAEGLRARAATLLGAVVVANAAHVVAYGWPYGYPLPGPYLYFAPFLLTTFQAAAGAALALISARDALRARGS